jgi:thiamine-monophosphate kinase
MSELDLIERITESAIRRDGTLLGVGDDAAVLAGAPGIVVTTDVLVEDVHFRRATTSLHDLGHKALAVNLSDLAAMGADPRAAVVGLVVPPSGLAAVDHDALRAGMEDLAATHGVTIAGGDLTSGPALVLAVTAIGVLDDPASAVTRAGAVAGDVVAVTGALGGAAAGLALLEGRAAPPDPDTGAALVDAHRRPTPRIDFGRALRRLGAHAMLDCSDGLLVDTGRMASASGVRIEIALDAVPLAPGVARIALALGAEADLFAATGGDDYELIVAMAPADVPRARAEGVVVHPIGHVREGTPSVALTRKGDAVAAPARGGWLHHV